MVRRHTTDKNCPLPTPEDRLLLILTSRKTSPLQVVQGRLLGIDQSKANQWIHALLVVLQATLRTLGMPPADPCRRDPSYWGDRGRSHRPGCAGGGDITPGRAASGGADVRGPLPPFGHDGTERRIERPQDPRKQTRYDRGKKKCHTVKNVLLINAVLTILVLSETYEGRTHDKQIAEATPILHLRAVDCSRI